MSLSDMAERAASSERPPSTEQHTAPGLAKAIAAVTAYFPVETVGSYLAVLAIMQPESNVERWLVFFLFLAFTAIVVTYYSWLNHQEEGLPPLDRRRLAWLLAFSGVSFTIWSATMPWTPFLVFTDDIQRLAGVAAIILAPLFPMAARVLHISPSWR